MKYIRICPLTTKSYHIELYRNARGLDIMKMTTFLTAKACYLFARFALKDKSFSCAHTDVLSEKYAELTEVHVSTDWLKARMTSTITDYG